MKTLTENNLPEWFKYAFSFDTADKHVNLPYAYVNELAIPGDIRTCRTTYINRSGLDFIGYTQAEVDQLGFDFYLQAVHPDDLKMYSTILKEKQQVEPKTLLVFFHRFKPKGDDQYSWFLCAKRVMEAFSDGSLKKVMVYAQLVSQLHDTKNMLLQIEKELDHYKYNATFDCLTPREKEVFDLVLNDKSNKEIATLLSVSVATINNHRYNMMQKLGVHSIAALAGLAFKNRVC